MLYFFKKTNSFIDDEAFIFTREDSPSGTDSREPKNRQEKFFAEIIPINNQQAKTCYAISDRNYSGKNFSKDSFMLVRSLYASALLEV